jgi:hypothetical protein
MDTGRIVAAVRDYKRRWRDRARDELQSFERESFRNAVERAGLARQPESKNGRKYRHQGSIPVAALEAAKEALLRDPGLGAVESFDELHERVEAAIGGIPRIGALTVYDTALRIGANLGLLPTKVRLLEKTSRSPHRGQRQQDRRVALREGELGAG